MTPCKLHNLTLCLICHREIGQCDFGTCQAPETVRVDVCRNGQTTPFETRWACQTHAKLIVSLNGASFPSRIVIG